MRRGLLLLAVALVGCAPFATNPEEARKGEPKGTRVAICYNGLKSGRAEVKKAAQQQCAANMVAMRVATDYYLDFCPIFLPERATFACVAKK